MFFCFEFGLSLLILYVSLDLLMLLFFKIVCALVIYFSLFCVEYYVYLIAFGFFYVEGF